VQVVIRQFAHWAPCLELRDNFLLRVQEYCADSVQTVSLEVTTVGSLLEDTRTTITQKAEGLYVPLAVKAVLIPLPFINRYAI
jgi:hypothetical protein